MAPKAMRNLAVLGSVCAVAVALLMLIGSSRSLDRAIAASAEPYGSGSAVMIDDADAEAIVVDSIDKIGVTAVENLPRVGDSCVIEVGGEAVLLVTRMPRQEDLPVPSEAAITTGSPMPPPPPPPSGDADAADSVAPRS